VEPGQGPGRPWLTLTTVLHVYSNQICVQHCLLLLADVCRLTNCLKLNVQFSSKVICRLVCVMQCYSSCFLSLFSLCIIKTYIVHWQLSSSWATEMLMSSVFFIYISADHNRNVYGGHFNWMAYQAGTTSLK